MQRTYCIHTFVVGERWTNEANRCSRTKGTGCTIVCSHVKVAPRPLAPAVVIAIRISPLFGTLVLPSLVYRSAMCGSFATMPTCFRGNDADTTRPKPLFKYPRTIVGAFFFSSPSLFHHSRNSNYSPFVWICSR